MSQCLHITFIADNPKEFLHDTVQIEARTLGIEGIAQLKHETENGVKIIACGSKQALEDFVDVLHKGVAKEVIHGMAIEPTLKERDFRGVFRIIE